MMSTITPEPVEHDQMMRRTTKHQPRRGLTHWLIGRPLPTADAEHETIGKGVGLAVFASDALSSTAYATQEMLVILAAAGSLAFGYVFPISVVIVALLFIVVVSYQQVITAYPKGGGAYIVAYDNLGRLPALTAAAVLLMDYILGVSVSISSGVAQIVSAFPQLFEYRVFLCLGFVALITVINFRGVRESGTAFAIPSYFFIIIMLFTIGTGLIRVITGSLGVVVDPPPIQHHGEELAGVTLFLILHAFSSGTTALTGVEAISNGITAFKEPRSRNGNITLTWLAVILGLLFMGISFLTREIHAVPSEQETVISQLARTVYDGQGLFYLLVIAGTTAILILAANTSFNGFPRLSATLAGDGFMPRQLSYRGSRLVYSYGILSLGVASSILIVIYQASVTRLIPLYAIGVFLCFTLAQIGMARRWRRSGQLKDSQQITNPGQSLQYDSKWKLKMIANSFGAVCTGAVMCVFIITKFVDGAWIILILAPILVSILIWIRRHYTSVASRLSLDHYTEPASHITRHRVIMPVSGVHQGTLEGLRYARLLSSDVTAVHVSIDPLETEKIQKKWTTWGDGVRLFIIDSPYRLFVEPLLNYIDEILALRQPNEIITIVVPQFVAGTALEMALHMNTADLLRKELLSTPGIVITDVPYQVSDKKENQ